jgi:DNA-binding GntR family transcriptional regulator
MDDLTRAYLDAVERGDRAAATAYLDRLFDEAGERLGEHARQLDEAAEATLGLFEAASEFVAEY